MSGHPLELLTTEEMGRADKAAVAAGVPSERLMEAAGSAVARAIVRRWAPRPTVVLAGPGNNGGDGFVVARLLAEAGWPVRVALMGRRGVLKGDAGLNAGRWTGACDPLAGPDALDGARLVVDALFGAGLMRPLERTVGAAIEAINERALDCVAVDTPSGVDGNTGEILGVAPRSRLTVTFFRLKPGHLLLPGRALAGEVISADIGIPESVLADIRPKTCINGPALWSASLPWPRPEDHKYSRGHAVIVGGRELTGAARLAARAARRVGVGLVTVAAPPEALAVYQGDWAGTMVARVDDAGGFETLLEDERKNAVLVGPGNGVGGETGALVATALRTRKPCVLDADALTSFEGWAETLFDAIRGPSVITPHDGEYARLFAETGDRMRRARAAASTSGAVVLLKGADTVIAAPDGRAAINANAPPELATAGTGDVLAGLIVGLMALGLAPFEAAAAGCWMHGEAAGAVGTGLIAEDLIEALPGVLRTLRRP